MTQCAENRLRACGVSDARQPLQMSQMPKAGLSASSGNCAKKMNRQTQHESYGEKVPPVVYEGNQRHCRHNQPYLTKPPIGNGRAYKNEDGRQLCFNEGGLEQHRRPSRGTIPSLKTAPDCHTNKRSTSKTDVNLQRRPSNPHPTASKCQFGGQMLKVGNLEKLVIQPGSPMVIEVCSATNQNCKPCSNSDTESSGGNSTECSEKASNIGIGDGTYKANAPKPKLPPAAPVIPIKRRSKYNMIHPECQELLNNIEKAKQMGKVSSHCQEMKGNIEINKQRRNPSQEMSSASYCNGLRDSSRRNSGQLSCNNMGSAQYNNATGTPVCSSNRRQIAQNNTDPKLKATQHSCNRQLIPYKSEKQCQPQRKVPNCLQHSHTKLSPPDWKKQPQRNRVTENQNMCSPPLATIKRSHEIIQHCSTNRIKQDSYLERVTSNKHLASEQKPDIVNQYLKITNLDTVIIQPGMPTVIKVCQGQSPQETELTELEQSNLILDKSKSNCSNEFSSNGYDQASNDDNQTSKYSAVPNDDNQASKYSVAPNDDNQSSKYSAAPNDDNQSSKYSAAPNDDNQTSKYSAAPNDDNHSSKYSAAPNDDNQSSKYSAAPNDDNQSSKYSAAPNDDNQSSKYSAAPKLQKKSSNRNNANKEKCSEKKNKSDSNNQQNQVQRKENPAPQQQTPEKGCEDESVLPQSSTKDVVESKDSCTCLPEAKQPQCGPATVRSSAPLSQQEKQIPAVLMPLQPRATQWQYGPQLSMQQQCAPWSQQPLCMPQSLQQQYAIWPQQKRTSHQSSQHCCAPPQQVSPCGPAQQQTQATMQRRPMPWPAQELAVSQPRQQSSVNYCAQNSYQSYNNMPAQPQQPSSWYPTSKSPEPDSQFCASQWESQTTMAEYEQQPQYETQYQNGSSYQYQEQQWPQNMCAQYSTAAQQYTDSQYNMAPVKQDPVSMNQCQPQTQQYDQCLPESQDQNNCDSYDENQVYSNENQGNQMYPGTCADDYNTQNVPYQNQSNCYDNNGNEFFNNCAQSSPYYDNIVCG